MNRMQAKMVLVAAVLLSPLLARAALDAALSAAITEAIANILLIIALGGAGFLTVAGAKVGWTVAAKFVSRLAGRA